MINKESIISIFDDKPTLLQWLKKVEAALNNASAVSFNVNKRGNATLTLSIVFEDGSEIESNEFVLEQGESVQSAEVVNGVLYLTLTNGDVLNAGNLFNGNITINGNVTASGDVEATGALKGASATITGNVNAGGDVEATGALKGASAGVSGSVTAGSVATTGGIVAGGGIAGQGFAAAQQVSTPKLTTLGDEIAAEKPIVEVMNGYYATEMPPSSYDISLSYVSISKNGNKLTMVRAGVINTTSTISAGTSFYLGGFDVPAAIANKLMPIKEGYSTLSFNYSLLYNPAEELTYGAYATITKSSGTSVTMRLRLLENLPANKEIFFRHETTFLLSENLAA